MAHWYKVVHRILSTLNGHWMDIRWTDLDGHCMGSEQTWTDTGHTLNKHWHT